MRIELYTFTYNDIDFLPFFLRYYEPIVDKMTFIDSGSKDGTLELIKNHTIVHTGLTWWDWDKLHWTRQNIWKDSDFDIVLFPDLDEIFYSPIGLRTFLETYKYDIYRMEGYQMVSRNFPNQGTNILNINQGVRLPLYDKFTIFNPKADVNFPNAHHIDTTCRNICKNKIKLLHYKFLGVDHMLKRARIIQKRVPKNSYCQCIEGNILEKFSGFVKNRRKYQEEIENLIKEAKPIL